MKNRNLLRIVSLTMLAALLIGALAGCGKEQGPKEELSASQVAEKLSELAAAQGLESAVDYADVFYGADFDKVEEFEVLSPMMNVKASEIAVFRVKDEKDGPEIQRALEQRAKDVQASFEFYLEDQYEIAKKAEIRSSGPFICLIIDENAAEMAEEFEEMMK